jgi:hypothetical protein
MKNERASMHPQFSTKMKQNCTGVGQIKIKDQITQEKSTRGGYVQI